MANDCIFCKLASIKEAQIAETKHLFAVYDKSPASPGHAMIIPKEHKVTMFELTEAEGKELGNILRLVQKEIESKHKPTGYNVGSNNGRSAGQVVMHLHIHVIPRYSGGHGIQILGEGEKE